MKVDEYDFDLPERLVAQSPCARRDASRLLVLGRRDGAMRHLTFRDLGRELRSGDLLVLNDTRVLPARLTGAKETGGRVEVLLAEPADLSDVGRDWVALLRASHPPKVGARIDLNGGLSARVIGRGDDETWRIRLDHPSGDPVAAVTRYGRMPLPPYIRREPRDPRDAEDRERYQTVFARQTGAAAAPTAGLHFSTDLLEALVAAGVAIATVTLHVGLGTFLPLRSRRIEDHRMHAESWVLPEETAQAVTDARRRGGRVVAVGTTVVRTLESRATEEGDVRPGSGRTDLFIVPGFRFRVVDALVTNFHLPRSTLLLLVCAFAGREKVLAAYDEAIRREYRFFSYGDAMLVVDR